MIGRMSKSETFSFGRLRQRIAETVESGQEVRQRVQNQIAEVLHQVELDAEGCQNLASSVLEGAQEGIRNATPENKRSRLCEVLDGLADGLAASAQTIRLTVEEARANGQHFAENDLRQAARNLKSLAGLFKNVLNDTASRASREFAEQWGQVKQHGRHAWERAKPSVDTALQTVASDPLGTGKEALQSGFKAATKATGALFAEIGKRLEALGNHLRS